MRVAIVGCGLIGGKRAAALARDDALVAVADTQIGRARALAAKYPTCTLVADDWRKVVERDEIDAIIVATTNDSLAAVTLAAVQSGKHVLVEKPAARTSAELLPILHAAQQRKAIVRVGFNHRFHPALLKAKQIVNSGAIGPLMFIRGRYGHGGRLGMEREWRGNPAISGGGEMLDQGVHLIDLSRWFLGDFADVQGRVMRYFWNWQVEDNGFAMLRTQAGQIAWLHASCTEWKNLFSFEIYGQHGKLAIDGLGGSYGTERLAHYQMLPEMGPPPTTIYEYPGPDQSWNEEWRAFATAINGGESSGADVADAVKALEIVERLYRESSN